MAQRLVLVDDTDSNIQYSGPWFTAQNTQLNTGDFGPPFQNTLHGVNVDASFSYSFSGSSIAVLGTSITTNSSGSQDPTWECFVDNNSIGWKTVLQFAENNWPFCQKDLQDGSHVLTVRVKVSNKNTFWFDRIQYNPSSNAQLDHAMLYIDSSDSALQYSSGWKGLNGIAMMTQTAGSTITYQFSGTSLTFYGFLPSNFPLTTSSATYSVDDQSPVRFLVPSGGQQLYNQVLFQTGQLSAGQHKLVVTHQGNSGTAPLALDYFVVQNAPSSDSSSSSSGNAQSPAQGSSQSSVSASSPTSSTGTTTNIASSNPTNSILGPSGVLSGFSSGVSSGVTGAASGSTISSGASPSGSSGSTSNQGASDSTGSSITTKPPLGIIIGGVLGGLAVLLLLLFLIFFIRRRNNRGVEQLSEKPLHSRDSNIINPFIGSPSEPTTSQYHHQQHHTFEGQSSANKLAQMRQMAEGPSSLPNGNMRAASPPTDASSSSVSGGSGGGLLPLSPLRNHTASPATTSSSLPFGGTMQPDGTTSKAREAEMGQRPATPQGVEGGGFLRHEDSGIRMPPATDNLVELPPLYTPG